MLVINSNQPGVRPDISVHLIRQALTVRRCDSSLLLSFVCVHYFCWSGYLNGGRGSVVRWEVSIEDIHCYLVAPILI